MIGPIGLLAHMAGGAIVGLIAGGWIALRITATAITERAIKRGLKKELQTILMPEADYDAMS